MSADTEIRIRVTPEEKKEIRDIAKQQGLRSMSNFFRWLFAQWKRGQGIGQEHAESKSRED